jgi:hypothetical protein
MKFEIEYYQIFRLFCFFHVLFILHNYIDRTKHGECAKLVCLIRSRLNGAQPNKRVRRGGNQNEKNGQLDQS